MTQSSQGYDATSKWLHWGLAVAIGLMFVSAALMDIELPPDQRKMLFTAHKTIGFFILLAGIFRLFWRMKHPAPRLPTEIMPKWQIKAAKAAHFSLYALGIFVPIAGWKMVSAGPYGLSLFGVLPVPNLPMPSSDPDTLNTLRHLFSGAHEILATILLIVIVIHVGAAIMHHFVDRDDILLRMSPQCLEKFLISLRGK